MLEYYKEYGVKLTDADFREIKMVFSNVWMRPINDRFPPITVYGDLGYLTEEENWDDDLG